MNNDAYIKYINSNTEKITDYVNSCFETSKEFIRDKLIGKIKEYINPLPAHYKIKDDEKPHDCSGILVKNGTVNPDQTVTDFLTKEYSGNKEATNISGAGWSYNTYGDELSYYTLELATDIMISAIKRYIETEFSVNLSDKDFEQIKNECRDFDDIYDNSVAYDFYLSDFAVKFAGIENLSLTEILTK